jgi:Chalcone isomerase-like
MGRKLAALLIGVALTGPAVAGQLEGVHVPESVTVDGSTLTLNGMGLNFKKVAFFKVKIYVASLYVLTRSQDAEAVIRTDEPRRLVIDFLGKEITGDKLVEAWNEGFNANSPDMVDAIKDRIAKFMDMWPTMRSGDRAVITYLPGKGTTVEIRGENKGTIPGADFASAVFAIWLGANPPNVELKNGLLGNR